MDRNLRGLQDSERRLQTMKLILERSPVVLFRWRAENGWPVDAVSENVTQLGYAPEEFLSGTVSFASIIHPEDVERVCEEVDEYSFRGLHSFKQEYRILRKEGEPRWFDAHMTVERNEKDRIVHYQGVLLDITERKLAEAALRASEREKAVILGSISELVVYQNRDMRILWANQAACNTVQMPIDALIGKTCHQIWNRSTSPCLGCPVVRVRETGRPQESEMITSDGRVWRVRGFPVLGDGGEVMGMVEICGEITDRKRAEEALRESEERFRALVETSSDWIWETNEHGFYTYSSPKVHDLLGYHPEEILGLSPFDLIPEEEKTRVKDLFETRFSTLQPFSGIESVHLHKHGRRVILETSGVPVFDTSGLFRGYRGIDRDITPRKQREDEIRRRNRELESLASIVDHANRSLDLDHLVSTVLPEIAQALEVRPVFLFLTDRQGSLLPKGSFGTVEKGATGEQQLRLCRHLCEEAIGQGNSIFCKNIPRDLPRLLPFSTSSGLVSAAAIPMHSPHQLEGILILCSSTERDFRENLSFLTAMADSLAAAIENADLYQQIKIHASMLELRVAERTAALETANRELTAFSYSVSHDLKAPLRAVQGFSQALEEEYKDALDPQGRDYLRRVNSGAQRMGQLIDDLLRLSHLTRGTLQRMEVDLGDMCHQLLKEFCKSDPERQVQWSISPAMRVIGDRHLLQVAMENLLGNAWKFTAREPAARIEVGIQHLEGERVFYVRDNGVGFKGSYSQKLFEPFQRLHSASEFPGSGVGLATVKRIVERHGGRVWAEGVEGDGAAFYFTLRDESHAFSCKGQGGQS